MNIFVKSITITASVVLPLAIISLTKLDTQLKQFWEEQTVLATFIFLFPFTIQIVRWTIILLGKEGKDFYAKRSISLSLFHFRSKK